MNLNDQRLLERIVERCGIDAVVAPEQTKTRVASLLGRELMAMVPLLRPANTAEVVFMIGLAREYGLSLVPAGGCTGLVGGLRSGSDRQWYLSLERMRRIERIDPVSRLAVVEAGVVLQTLQDAAADQGMLFAVDLGGRGSATVGGLVSTNAGGERVLRFGMMREQILGLEVVTADGTVLDLMGEVMKNNAGYDLKQLFIGSEGTLGIVTRAVVRLRPAFAGHDTAFLALADITQLPAALTQLERGLGGALSAFEFLWPEFMQTMCEGKNAHRMPVAGGAPGYMLVEAEGGEPATDHQRFVAVLERLLEQGIVRDAAIAQSESERQALWAIRNDVARIRDYWHPAVAFDVSVPIASMVSYVDELRATLTARWPQARALVFGHVADNNLHIAVTIGEQTLDDAGTITDIVYAGVASRKGSISAEHGIGLDKRESLVAHRPPAVMALMRQVKQWLDPKGVLNPGKVV